MSKVIASITTSVDGYITGPGDGPEYGLGRGGERLHYWVMGGPWTYEGGHDFAMHGPDKEFYDGLVSTMASGVVGRGMYDAAGAWGGTNPFPGTLFVLTHRTADQPAPETGFRFVADLETALGQAAEAAGRVEGCEHTHVVAAAEELLGKRLDVPVHAALIRPGIWRDKSDAHEGLRVTAG